MAHTVGVADSGKQQTNMEEGNEIMGCRVSTALPPPRPWASQAVPKASLPGSGEPCAGNVGGQCCRLIVHILAARSLKKKESGPDAKEPVFNLQLEHVVHRSRANKEAIVEDGLLDVNQSFSFQVIDKQRAVLSVQVVAKGLLGMEEWLGHTRSVSVSEVLEEALSAGGAPRWFDLLSKDGKRLMPGKLQMHIVAALAEPEQRVHALVGSWNVGNSRPPEDLSPWLPPGLQHEIVALGSQECEYPARQGLSDCGTDWVERLSTHLGRSKYRLVQAVSRGQMRLAVFVREGAHRAVTDVHTSSEATGVGHVVANKGGVCISLKYWDTGLCFVNSHFAAHAGHRGARNSNFREITGQMRVGIPGVDILNQFHHLFWMGDLNYRLDAGMEEWKSVVAKVRAGQQQELLAKDELTKERDAGRVFHGFKEGVITFAPTFKLRKGTVAEYNPKRLPAWCDRILWKDLPGCAQVELLSYTSAPEITSSDHKPVAASFAFTVRSLPCSVPPVGEERWNIRFKTLRARDLRSGDINGLSDPYLSFLGPMLLQEVHSKVKAQTLNPVWEPAHDLRPLVLTMLPLERIRMDYLLVRILDRDFASSDDYLAYGVIPLAGVVDAFDGGQGQVADFRVDLSYHGLPAGILEGSMQLSYEKSKTKRKGHMKTELMDRTALLRDSIIKRIVSRRHVTS